MTESNIIDGAYRQDVQNVYSASIVATSILMVVFMAKPSSWLLINLTQMNYIEDHIYTRLNGSQLSGGLCYSVTTP